jgi:hypothetical protein
MTQICETPYMYVTERASPIGVWLFRAGYMHRVFVADGWQWLGSVIIPALKLTHLLINESFHAG